MKFNALELTITSLHDNWLSYSEEAFQEPNRSNFNYPNETAHYYAELNRICLNALIQWVQNQIDVKTASLAIPSEEDLISRWSLINGTPLRIGETRIVLLPNEAEDTDELIVPQEWVDIPDWVANYYLAIQCDREQKWIRIWGYATHEMLKEKGEYDPIDRCYSLEQEEVISDLEVLWLGRQFCPNETVTVPALPRLEENTAKKLLEQISQPSPYSPRLELEFEQWASLIQSEQWRHQLHHLRLQNQASTAQKGVAETIQDNCINLVNWLEGNITQATQLGWRNVEELLSGDLRQQLAFRENVREQVNYNTVEKAKLVDLQVQVDKTLSVVLLVAVKPEAENKTGILIQLHPERSQKFLPAELKLTLLSDGNILQQAVSRERDNYIQIPYCRCLKGVELEVQITFGETLFREKLLA
jgi:hypothetical protein